MIKQPSVNAVILANQLNLSIFQQIWLIDNGIIDKDDCGSESYFNPVAVNVRNQKYDLLILPDRIQITCVGNIENSYEIFSRIISGIIKALPHTPYTAYGFNFNYLISSKNSDDNGKIFRELCLSTSNPLVSDFAEPDARFGVYMSQDIDDIRLRLDIKPARLEDGLESIVVAANYHKDTSNLDDILSGLKNLPKLHKHVDALIHKLNGYMENGN